MPWFYGDEKGDRDTDVYMLAQFEGKSKGSAVSYASWPEGPLAILKGYPCSVVCSTGASNMCRMKTV